MFDIADIYGDRRRVRSLLPHFATAALLRIEIEKEVNNTLCWT
jgi:hypothetical protein